MRVFTAEIKDEKVNGEWILCLKDEKGKVMDEIPCSIGHYGHYPPSTHEVEMWLKIYQIGVERGDRLGWTFEGDEKGGEAKNE